MWRRLSGLVLGLMLLGGGGLALAERPALSVPQAPALDVSGDGAAWRYELYISHGGPTPITLTELAVTDMQGRPVLSLAGAALAAAVNDGEKGLTLPSGGTLVLYLDLPAGAVGTTERLRHVVTVRTPDGHNLRLSDDAVILRRQAPLMIGAPLAGGPWVAVHSAQWPRGHRRVFYSMGARGRIPGRFAIDFVKVSPDGTITDGDPDRPADAHGYGADVLAVADATVAALRDGMAEGASIKNSGRHASEDAAGNHVVLELSPGRFAFYEHLKPGSIRVKVGDRVRRGQVLAQLGFTGDSTGPHLHFHIADAVTPLGAEGLPFTIDHYTLLGRYEDLAKLGSARWVEQGPEQREAERPGENSVISFAP